MWHLTTSAAPDIADFVATLHDTSFFSPLRALTVARAPGRLDLMGGIADYSGALVLELPLAMAAVAAVQLTDEPYISVCTTQISDEADSSEVRLALADLAPDGVPLSYAAARALFAADAHIHWAAYLIGVPLVLALEKDISLRGMQILLASAVPAGKGVSSSAAIEVATMRAVAAALGVELDGRTLAILCQKVENLIVGAPCGIMDQMTSACGEANTLLALGCQPAELEPAVRIPAGLAVWGIDSGIRHAVTGADYGSVRVGAFMGYRIVTHLAGAKAYPVGPGRVSVADPFFRGYLANVTPARWLHQFRDQVPVSMRGGEFLAQYGGFTDSVTHIDSDRTYAIRMPTEHPIHEHHRVKLFRALLQRLSESEEQSPDPEIAELLGELMFQSHASYSACRLGSDGTDALVSLVRRAGSDAGLYGAKITGGGSGGTVAILARHDAEAAIHTVARMYAQESGRSALVIGGSSPGAMASGVYEAVWR